MARQIIDIGVQGNDGTGDSIRESFRKVNDNFSQIFSIFGSGETISFKDLDDTPDVFGPDQLIISDNEGVALLAKDLVGGEGISVDHSDPNQIIIESTGGKLQNDSAPKMIGHLNANGFIVGNVSNFSDLSESEIGEVVTTFNNLHATDITADDVLISRGYADRRYVQGVPDNDVIGGGGQVRVRLEPGSTAEYFKEIEDWVGGYAIVTGHGFNSSITGSPFVYTNDGTTPPTGLVTNDVYYIRYVDDTRLSVFLTRSDAIENTNRIFVNIDPIIDPADRGIEQFVDEFYDSTLQGNWVSNEALPRISVVRRQGDRMDGPLYLEDHPGELAGASSPNGLEDYQAATKFYVDSSSFASQVNLFVATSGDDLQPLTPNNKKGRALSYAFATIARACKEAESLINNSLTEPGPYRQRLTYDSGNNECNLTTLGPIVGDIATLSVFTNGSGVDQTKDIDNRDLREGSVIKGIRSGATGLVISYDGVSSLNALYTVKLLHKITDLTTFESNYVLSSDRLNSNIEFIKQQTVAFLRTDDPSSTFEISTCLRDIGYIITAISHDIKFGGNKETLKVARSYYTDNNTLAIPLSEKAKTITAIDYAFDLIEYINKSNVISSTGTIGLITGTGPWVVTIGGITSTLGLVAGTTLVATSGTGSLGSGGTYTILSIDGPTEIRVTATGGTAPSAGTITNIISNIVPPSTDPNEFGTRVYSEGSFATTAIQNTSGLPGEASSLNLIDKLLTTIKFVIDNGLNPASTPLLEFNESLDGGVTPGEPLEYGQPVPETQITIRVESGIYYEQLPIRLPANCSIKGDEFRRSIIRPAPGESQSEWVKINFYRDDEFDGLTRTYIGTTTSSSSGNTIIVSSAAGLEIGMYLKVVSGTGQFNELTQVQEITGNVITCTITPTITILSGATIRGLNALNLAPTGDNFAYHYLIDPTPANVLTARPKQNKDMDVFLLNDGTILRNITAQGHGGFMCVLDPEGQIQTKSPYFQTATSLSGSINRQRFAGGMLIDGFAGNLTASISGKTNNFQLTVTGLNVRLPQVPTSFFIEGRRYQVNRISSLGGGTATIYLDASSNPNLSGVGIGYDESEFIVDPGVIARDIIFETAGNRSMLANDFTQVNDLGYGCVATNNGISELVSVFTYYNWTSYFSLNGGQIRSVTGNSSYGEYGLRSAGRDPNEVPDTVFLGDAVLQQATIYRRASLSSKNSQGDNNFYIDNYWYIPFNTSEVEIDHTPKKSSLVSVSITSGGIGYAVGDSFEVTGGTKETGTNAATFSVSEIDNGATGGPGVITKIDIITPGSYVSTSAITFTNSPVGVWPTISGSLSVVYSEASPTGTPGSSATFDGTFLGSRNLYEVTTIEKTSISNGSGYDNLGNPTTLYVLKLNLDSAGATAESQPKLSADLYDGQIVSIRSLQKLRFTGVDEVKPVRPSTALEFQGSASGGQILRTLAYELSNSVGESFPLTSGQAILSFDTNYEYVLIDVDTSNLSGGYGSTANDTKIAILEITGEKLTRINSGELIFHWQGRGHQITGYSPADTDGVGTPGYISFTNLALGQGSIIAAGSGLVEGITSVRNTTLRAGVNSGTSANITVRISTCRATAHDMLDVGSGGYNSTNYPNNLYGAPATDPLKTKEVVEETQGRVFYVSTDQNGIFKVGKFFEVDQGTGNVTFNAPITLTDLNGIGFKKGTFVTEFSTDSTMEDNDSNAVPVESAVRGYIDSRLGLVHDTNITTPVLIGPGYLPLDGSKSLTGNFNLNNNRITNLASPISSSDAANKSYVDTQLNLQDELKELSDVTFLSSVSGDLVVLSPNGNHTTNARITGDIGSTISFTETHTSVLQNSIGSGTITTIDLNSSVVLWPSQGYVKIEDEIIYYGNKPDADSLGNLVRGEFSTTPASHLNGVSVTRIDYATLNLQIESGAISNSDVNASAAIDQSKLSMNAATTRADAIGITQADRGLASFDSANFEITNGWVGIKSGGIALTEIQNIAAGRILGNLTGSASSPQEVTTTDLVSNGVNSNFNTIDSGAYVLTRRFNSLKTSPSSTFTNINPVTPVTASGNISVPVTSNTGTGNGAIINISWAGSTWNTFTVIYGGNGYAVNDELKVDKALLGPTFTNDLIFTIENIVDNIDADVYFGLDKTSIAAEANSIVKTDSNKNLGNDGNKFNNIYSTTFTGNVIGNVTGNLTGNVTGNVAGNVTGNLTGSVLTASQSNITSLGTLTSLSVNNILYLGISSNITASGSTRGGATLIASMINNVSSLQSGLPGVTKGVVFPSIISLGTRIIIRNDTPEDIYVYPQTGARINQGSEGDPYLLRGNTGPDGTSAVEFIYVGLTNNSSPDTLWFTLSSLF